MLHGAVMDEGLQGRQAPPEVPHAGDGMRWLTGPVVRSRAPTAFETVLVDELGHVHDGVMAGVLAPLAELGEKIELELLDLYQALPLVREQVVDLLVELPDLQLRLEVHLIVVL
jgi:hypothetical protein